MRNNPRLPKLFTSLALVAIVMVIKLWFHTRKESVLCVEQPFITLYTRQKSMDSSTWYRSHLVGKTSRAHMEIKKSKSGSSRPLILIGTIMINQKVDSLNQETLHV